MASGEHCGGAHTVVLAEATTHPTCASTVRGFAMQHGKLPPQLVERTRLRAFTKLPSPCGPLLPLHRNSSRALRGNRGAELNSPCAPHAPSQSVSGDSVLSQTSFRPVRAGENKGP